MFRVGVGVSCSIGGSFVVIMSCLLLMYLFVVYFIGGYSIGEDPAAHRVGAEAAEEALEGLRNHACNICMVYHTCVV